MGGLPRRAWKFFRGPLWLGPNFCKFYITDIHNGRVTKSCARESQLVVVVSFWHYKLNFLYLVIELNVRRNQQQHNYKDQVNPLWFLYYHASKSREKDAPVPLWLWFHWVAGLLGGGSNRPPCDSVGWVAQW